MSLFWRMYAREFREIAVGLKLAAALLVLWAGFVLLGVANG